MDELLGVRVPQSMQAEQAVIGSMLIDPACIPEVLKGLVYVLASMLADGQRRKLNKLRGQVDRKLRSKIEEKRAAHGIKTDGIAYYSDPYNEDQSL